MVQHALPIEPDLEIALDNSIMLMLERNAIFEGLRLNFSWYDGGERQGDSRRSTPVPKGDTSVTGFLMIDNLAPGRVVHAAYGIYCLDAAAFARYHATVVSIPSRSEIWGCHPMSRKTETSSTFRGVPSGFVASQSVSPR